MTDALTAFPPAVPAAPVVTRDQLDLIKKTVAVGATDAELELFLFDCSRRGVHPLDRLIHFTKRGGRYTPITSIDFLRGRAHDTGEMAGSDDVVFDKDARTATVTVYRLTRGTRYAYSATARYTEYVPAPGQDHMWKRMPHVMLGKCAEALALRKAFPQQLGGLYVKEELEQARPDFATEATAIADQYALPPVTTLPPEADPDQDARDQPEVHHMPSERLARLAQGVVLITHLQAVPTKNPNVIRTTLTVAGGPSWPADQTRVTTINERLADRAERAWHAEQAVAITVAKGKFGYELATIEDAHERGTDPAVSDRDDFPS
jgi:phage recombination protein Bet